MNEAIESYLAIFVFDIKLKNHSTCRTSGLNDLTTTYFKGKAKGFVDMISHLSVLVTLYQLGDPRVSRSRH